MRLVDHNIRLSDKKVVLRPLTEQDWHLLYEWNNDAEVLYYVEEDDVSSRTMEQVKDIYRKVSLTAFCFIIETEKEPIGECWLQTMNLKRILEKYTECDCRRIDIMIGNKDYWGKGLGTRTIGLLTTFGFEAEFAEYIFGCDVTNPRSLKAFAKNGFRVDTIVEKPAGHKFAYTRDLVLSRTEFKEKRR